LHNRLRAIDSRKVIKILRYFGFECVSQTGSHQKWKKDIRRVEVVAAAKSFSRWTLKSMIEQSGYSEGDWLLALDEI